MCYFLSFLEVKSLHVKKILIFLFGKLFPGLKKTNSLGKLTQKVLVLLLLKNN